MSFKFSDYTPNSSENLKKVLMLVCFITSQKTSQFFEIGFLLVSHLDSAQVRIHPSVERLDR